MTTTRRLGRSGSCQIFATAKNVIAWLGESETEEALKFIVTLHNAIRDLQQAGQSITRDSLQQRSSKHGSTGWRALSKFLDNPYFQRAWVIQEMVFSNDTDLIYGQGLIKWETLGAIISHIIASGSIGLLYIVEEGKLARQPDGIVGVVVSSAIRNLHRSEKAPRLLWCMFNCWTVLATDPRDKIFALLGLASDAGDAEFTPRYGQRPEDVYKDTTLHLLTRDTSCTYILHGAGIGLARTLPNLPSWVPDWSSPSLGTIWGTLSGEARFRASGSSDMAGIRYREDSSSIVIRGRIIEAVAAIRDAWPQQVWHTQRSEQQKMARIELAWIQSLRDLLQPDQPYPTGEAFFPDVIARTLIGNKTHFHIPASPEYVTYFTEWLAGKQGVVDGDAAALQAATPEMQQERELAISRYAAALANVIGTRRVFLTGQFFLGLGPQGIQQEDEVCILFGLTTPFVIRRRKEGCYFLVGECYIHGLMNGEGLNMGKEQDIILY